MTFPSKPCQLLLVGAATISTQEYNAGIPRTVYKVDGVEVGKKRSELTQIVIDPDKK